MLGFFLNMFVTTIYLTLILRGFENVPAIIVTIYRIEFPVIFNMVEDQDN
jgi:hypothetical protein